MTESSKSPMVTAYERFFENQAPRRSERVNLAMAKHYDELTRIVNEWNGGNPLDFSAMTSTMLQASIDMTAILFEAHAGAVFAAVDVYLETKGKAGGDDLTAEDIEKALRRAAVGGGCIN